MKLFILTLTLSFLSIISQAQNDTILTKEILEYNTSKTDLISKARRLMLDKFTEGNLNKVREIKDYLLYQVEDNNYAALYPVEKWLILYWTKDYAELTQSINETDSAKIVAFQKKIKPSPDQLYEKLIQKTREMKSQVETDINHSNLQPADQDFLLVALNYFISGEDYKGITQITLNTLADDFLQKHPDSPYDDFIRKNIRYKLKPGNWGIAFELFSGYGLLTNQLSDHFKRSIPLGVAFDVSYKKVCLYLRDYIGFSRTKTDIPYQKGIWEKKSAANIIIPEASLGYTAVETNRIKLAPFAGISAIGIQPTEYDIKDNKALKDAGLDFTTSYMLGVNLDLKLGKQVKESIISGPTPNYSFIRIRYSYNMPQFDNKYTGFSGTLHSITIGWGGFARKLKRDL